MTESRPRLWPQAHCRRGGHAVTAATARITIITVTIEDDPIAPEGKP